MPLLPARLFAEVFMPLKGKRIGYLRSFGNVGDRLIDWAAFQLFESFSLCWRIVEVEKPGDVDELVFAGGGNMGLSKSNAALRGNLFGSACRLLSSRNRSRPRKTCPLSGSSYGSMRACATVLGPASLRTLPWA